VKRPPLLVRKVEAALRRHGIAGGIVVAVSGGPDSVALLHALRDARGAAPLVAAHLNHQLRGPESDADEAFVRELCHRLSIDCRVHRLDVRAAADVAKDNLEAVARRLRYDWLAHTAGEVGAAWVATGHTANDQAETVLHRLLRGTGLRGLRAIAARRELAARVCLVRPLLAVTRAEVIAYLTEIGQEYRQDSSNRDPARTRNRIRTQLLPLLTTEYNSRIIAVLARLAGQAEEAFAGQSSEAHSLLAAAELPRAAGVLVFDAARLAAAPRALLREMFRLVWEREGWPVAGMGFDAWERVAAVALGETGAAELPDGIRVQSRERVVQLRKRP
jgi:tRNA(Ile)-lysidine synthase